MCLKSQIIHGFACVLSFFTKQVRPSRGMAQQGSIAVPSTTSSRCCRDTAHQGSACPHQQNPPYFHRSHTGSTEASRKSLLPHYHGDLQAASHTSSWAHSHGGKGSDNSSGKGTPDLLPVCSTGSIPTQHYQKLWVRDNRLFLTDSLLFNPLTEIFGCKTFLPSPESIKTCQSTVSFKCFFCNLTPK